LTHFGLSLEDEAMEKFYKRKGDGAFASIEGSSAPESEGEPLALV
jgi:hypothetical protein